MNLTTLAEYTGKAKSTGLLMGLGSELWAIPENGIIMEGTTRFLLLTGGTRVEASYKAYEDEP